MTLTITPKVHTPNADALNFGDLVDGEFLKRVGDEITSAAVAGGGDMVAANNLSDVADIPTALSNLFGGVAGEVTIADNDLIPFQDVSETPDLAKVITLANLKANIYKPRTVTAQFGGPGGSITVGDKVWVRVPFAGTVTKVSMLGDAAGSMVVDVWKDTYANYPPTVADTITAAAKPTLSAANKSEDSTLTGWTTAVASGDVLVFNVDSVSGLTHVHVTLEITPS